MLWLKMGSSTKKRPRPRGLNDHWWPRLGSKAAFFVSGAAVVLQWILSFLSVLLFSALLLPFIVVAAILSASFIEISVAISWCTCALASLSPLVVGLFAIAFSPVDILSLFLRFAGFVIVRMALTCTWHNPIHLSLHSFTVITHATLPLACNRA